MKFIYFFFIPTAVLGKNIIPNEEPAHYDNLIKAAIAKFQKEVACQPFYQLPRGWSHDVYHPEQQTDLKMYISENKFYHLPEVILEKFEVNREEGGGDYVGEFSIYLPIFNYTAHYEAGGHVQGIPINGNGIYTNNFEKFSMRGKFGFYVADTTLQLKWMEWKYNFEDIYFHITNLQFLHLTEEGYNAMLFGWIPEYLKTDVAPAETAKKFVEDMDKYLKTVDVVEIGKKLREYVDGSDHSFPRLHKLVQELIFCNK